jgi:branched-subunit amino acid transport protein
MSALVVFAVVAAGSYLLRLTMLVVLEGRSLPRVMATPVGLIAPAAVGALAVGALAGHGHVADVPTIVASIAAFAVVRRTHNMTYGLLAGFPVLWLLHALTHL